MLGRWAIALVVAGLAVPGGLAGCRPDRPDSKGGQVSERQGSSGGEATGQVRRGQAAGREAGAARESRQGDDRGGRGQGGGGLRPVAVALVKVESRDMVETLDLAGTLEARRQVAVSPRMAGRLADVLVELGDRVAAGQVLARLDDFDLQARVRQAEASEAGARAALGQREADAVHLQRQAKRDRDLLAKEYVARADVEDSEARAQAARAAVTVARAELGRQRAALAEARTAVGQTVLIAPMVGVVAVRHADPGAVVSASSPVVTLIAPGDLKAVVQIPEAALSRVRPGTRAALKVDAWPAMSFPAAIARISPVVAPDTRQAQAELTVRNGGGRLRPGMLARVALEVERRSSVPAVPAEAIIVRQGQDGVFVKDGDKARFQPVIAGVRTGGWVEMRSGLGAGAQVVTLGNHLLQDGSPVRAGDGRPGREGRAERGTR